MNKGYFYGQLNSIEYKIYRRLLGFNVSFFGTYDGNQIQFQEITKSVTCPKFTTFDELLSYPYLLKLYKAEYSEVEHCSSFEELYDHHLEFKEVYWNPNAELDTKFTDLLLNINYENEGYLNEGKKELERFLNDKSKLNIRVISEAIGYIIPNLSSHTLVYAGFQFPDKELKIEISNKKRLILSNSKDPDLSDFQYDELCQILEALDRYVDDTSFDELRNLIVKKIKVIKNEHK